MSVSSQANSTAARLARWLLGCAVRHWPEESRPWGLALAAEIDETAGAFETVRWSLGGMMFFARSVLSGAWTWLKLPAGGSLPGGAEGPSMLPKRSRMFTAGILVVAVLLLFLPEGREAMRTVKASWQGFQQSNSDVRTLKELAARAEKEKDASTLAFVALGTSDPKKASALTERAIALDPALIWVYGAKYHRPNYDPPREEWLTRLQLADPGNAVPYLLAADALDPLRIRPLYQHGILKDAEFEVVESDSKWLGLMERAYGAPRYDSYFQKHYQLTRAVWNRERGLSPVIVLSGLRFHAIPNLLSLRFFAHVRIHEAQKARAAGDLGRAERLLGEVDAFGTRMADGSEVKIEKLIGMAISRNAEKELADFYSSTGNAEDALRAASRVEQIDERARSMRPGHDPAIRAQAQAFQWEGLLVQGFGTLGVIAGFAALAGILLLELWPSQTRNAKTIWRRALCWIADYAPATLLVASAAFLMSFLPFQHAFAEYRSSSYVLANHERLVEALGDLNGIPDYVMGVNARVLIWAFVTIALTALLLLVLVRGNFRARRAASNPA
jgi:tetratricopeptide (TPR) repeat protein